MRSREIAPRSDKTLQAPAAEVNRVANALNPTEERLRKAFADRPDLAVRRPTRDSITVTERDGSRAEYLYIRPNYPLGKMMASCEREIDPVKSIGDFAEVSLQDLASLPGALQKLIDFVLHIPAYSEHR